MNERRAIQPRGLRRIEAALVARLETQLRANKVNNYADGKDRFTVADVAEAVSTIRALEAKLHDADAVIQRLSSGAELQAIMGAHNDTLAKLRDAVEVIRPFAASSVTFNDFNRASAFLATMAQHAVEKTDDP